MKVSTYVRCSSDLQDTAHQTSALLGEINRRGWTLTETFEDAAMSGSIDNRPGLLALLEAVKAGRVEVLMVTALDRLARSAVTLLQIERTLRRHGVALVSQRESLDATTPTGRLMLQMFGAFAEFERAAIIDRVRSGCAHKRRQRGVTNAAAVSDSDILALHRKEPGISVRAIAKRLGAGKSTVANVLAAARNQP